MNFRERDWEGGREGENEREGEGERESRRMRESEAVREERERRFPVLSPHADDVAVTVRSWRCHGEPADPAHGNILSAGRRVGDGAVLDPP